MDDFEILFSTLCCVKEEVASIQSNSILIKSTRHVLKHVLTSEGRPGIRGTQVKSSVRMKKTQESSKWLFLGNLIPEIDSKAPN
jgi:hypothetical protein